MVGSEQKNHCKILGVNDILRFVTFGTEVGLVCNKSVVVTNIAFFHCDGLHR